MAQIESGDVLRQAGVVPMRLGVFLSEYILPKLGLSFGEAAEELGISQAHFADILADRIRVDHPLAERLAIVTGMSAQFWLNMQAAA